jgi:hypothetical protein
MAQKYPRTSYIMYNQDETDCEAPRRYEYLCQWFEKEYPPALEYTGVRSGKYIHNMDDKGCRVACPAGQEVVVPIGIKEMYVGVPENRLSLTVIESISVDGKAIPPVVIVPGGTIMESWFHENMTGHEVVTVSPSGYINEEICIGRLNHFIKHNDCGPDKPWIILLMDGATCHDAPEFIFRAKMNLILMANSLPIKLTLSSASMWAVSGRGRDSNRNAS